MTRWLVLLLVAGCSSLQPAVTLLPRGDAPKGVGVLDKGTYQLNATFADGRRYAGKMIVHPGLQASALLLGEDGQLRCDFAWEAFMSSATGVCVDAQNRVYDMMVK